jgi:hypothetical protein
VNEQQNISRSGRTNRHGIAIVANDRVLKWLLPFLESYRATNFATALYVIPYDENIAITRRAAEIYGANWVDDDMSAVDALGKRLYPLFPHHRRRLRKLRALALPLERVIYLDVDTILFRDFSGIFEAIRPGRTDFVIASSSDDYVYNEKRQAHAFLRTAKLFNDGFFLTSNDILSLRDFERVVDADEELFHSVRKRGMLFAQPLVNFVVHRMALKVRSLAETVPQASDESYYKAEGAVMGASGPIDWQGREIYFAHWAGAIAKPRKRVFDAAWLDFSKRAITRMKT